MNCAPYDYLLLIVGIAVTQITGAAGPGDAVLKVAGLIGFLAVALPPTLVAGEPLVGTH